MSSNSEKQNSIPINMFNEQSSVSEEPRDMAGPSKTSESSGFNVKDLIGNFDYRKHIWVKTTSSSSRTEPSGELKYPGYKTVIERM